LILSAPVATQVGASFFIRLGRTAISGLVGQVVPIAKPYLDELREESGERV
jgi:hypothetical protein